MEQALGARERASEHAFVVAGTLHHLDSALDLFAAVSTRLAGYLKTTFGLPSRASTDAAQRLLGQILFPLIPRALFGLEQCIEEFDPRALSPKVDLRPVRKAVAELIESMPTTKP